MSGYTMDEYGHLYTMTKAEHEACQKVAEALEVLGKRHIIRRKRPEYEYVVFVLGEELGRI